MIVYKPFISEIDIPEAKEFQPIPISVPLYMYQGADPDREVIPVYLARPESKKEEVKKNDSKKISKPTIPGTYSDDKKFVSDLTSAYEKELEARGLSKEYAKYIVAQDAHESNWGKSSLVRYYNFGGIKEFNEDEGIAMNTEEYEGKEKKKVTAAFKKFKDLNDYIKYKLDLLGNSNYDVFSYAPDQLYIRLVTAKNKYATDPDYLNKMNEMYKAVLARS